MSISSIKIKLYRFFDTPIGSLILKSLIGFVKVPNLKKANSKVNKPFIVSITIDTESGYIDENDHRIWQKSKPQAYIGYYKGIENWRKLLKKYNAKATFFLSTNCFKARGNEYKKIVGQLRHLIREGHEIGLHLHPDSDFALQKSIGKEFNATSAYFLNKEEIKMLISHGKKLIKRHLNIEPKSFRWGNWALNTDAVESLQENGFQIDSSAVPGIKGHENDPAKYDWSKTKQHYPWKLSKSDYQNTINK